MMILRFVHLLPFIFLLSSCSYNKPTFVALTPSIEDESIVYIYRPSSLSNAVISPMLKINGEENIEISNNSYSYVQLAADKYIFKLDLSKRYIGNTEIELDIKPQRTYFLKISTSLKFEKNKPYTRRFDIKQHHKDIALTEIKNIPYVGENKNQTTKKSSSITEKTKESQFSIDKTRNPFSK